MGDTTFRFGGVGMMVVPVCPCRIHVTDANELVVSHGDTEVARFTPGEAPAIWPNWETPTTATFGGRGPRLAISGGLQQRQVFSEITARLPDGPWAAVCTGGLTIQVPPNVEVHAANADDYFELRLPGSTDEVIAFRELQVPAELIDITHEPNQTLVQREQITVGDRTIGVVIVAFSVEGVAWRQAMITVPVDKLHTMLLRAHARADFAETLFEAAMTVAATLLKVS